MGFFEKYIRQHAKKIAFIAFTAPALFFVYSLCVPKVLLGDVFFGGVPRLYNVSVAQFFFAQGAHPVFGKPEPYAYHQLSRTYFIKGNLDESLSMAYRELLAYPTHGGTYYVIGLTLGYLDREQEAIDVFTKFIAHDPTSWAAHNDKAWLQFRIGDIDGGLETMQPIARVTTNPWIQNTYGVLLMNKGRDKESEAAFMHAWEAVRKMTQEEWGNSYPGNDPRVYSTGLRAMEQSIVSNITLVRMRQAGAVQ